MMNLKPLILAILLTTGLLSGAAFAIEPYKATYKLDYGSFNVGEAFYELRIDELGELLFSARVEPRGLVAMVRNDRVSEQSRLRLDDDGRLVALRYDYLHERGRRIEEEKRIRFDWDDGVAISEVDGKEERLSVEPGTVDRMSLQLKVMQDAMAGIENSRLVYQAVEDHELRDYEFEVKGRERVETLAGVFNTVRLERRHGSRTTIFWSAPDLGYLPVRVEQRREGRSTSRMDMTEISGPLATGATTDQGPAD